MYLYRLSILSLSAYLLKIGIYFPAKNETDHKIDLLIWGNQPCIILNHKCDLKIQVDSWSYGVLGLIWIKKVGKYTNVGDMNLVLRKAFNIFQVYQYFTGYRGYFFF